MKGIKSILQALGVLVALPACSQQPSPAGSSAAYAAMLNTLYHNTVPLEYPAKLAATLRRHPDSVVLLDTRTPDEYGVSHLRGARFLNVDSYTAADFAAIPRDKPVVVYCSVGYRSERVGEKLKELGFRDIHNLYGGIFEWVNEGYPVYNAKGPTTDVHPYSALWGIWLKRGNKVYEPETN